MLFLIEMIEDDTFALGLMLFGAWHFLSGPVGYAFNVLQQAI